MNREALKQTPEYKLWRANIYRRDRWKCKICGNKDKIEAHHIQPIRSHPMQMFEHENGITLCMGCHRLIYGKELLVSKWLIGLINKNSANSVELRKDNTEPSQGRNPSEGVTTRNRDFDLNQFIKKEIPCTICGKMIVKRYYQYSRKSMFCCSIFCKSKLLSVKMKGSGNPNYKEKAKCFCLFCGQETSTPSTKNRVKIYCNNVCQLKYEYANGTRQLAPYLNGRWSKDHKYCVLCGKKDYRHYGKGKCMSCYNKRYWLNKVSNIPMKARAER